MAKSSITSKSFKGAANLIKLLPSGTVFIFQFLSPLLTVRGQCHPTNKYLTATLLLSCAATCCFSSFTDSFTDDGIVYYGVVTTTGLRTFTTPRADCKKDVSKNKLRFGDFVHGTLSLLVFAALAVLNSDIVGCFCPHLGPEYKVLTTALPVVVGAMSSFIFMVYPNTRHGIGYAASETLMEISSENSKLKEVP